MRSKLSRIGAWLTGVVSVTAFITAGAGIASAASSSVYVRQNNCSDVGPGTSQNPYCHVQTAVDNVKPQGTVTIAPGTYQETVTIPSNKPGITLLGAGRAATIIKAPAATTPAGSNIVTISARNVSLQALGVYGPFNAGGCLEDGNEYGIYLTNGASARLQNLNVFDVQDVNPALRGCQQGIAIRIGQQSFNNVASATLQDVAMKNYQKGGVVVDGEGSSADMQAVTATGYGPTAITAQNGFQVSRGANATIRGSSATDNIYTPQTYTASGFLFSEAGRLTISQNTANRNDVGFDIDAKNAQFKQNTANNNVFNGIYAEPSSSGNQFIQNTAFNNKGGTAFPPYDIEDDSHGNRTLGTANTWRQNNCATSLPDGLCRQ